MYHISKVFYSCNTSILSNWHNASRSSDDVPKQRSDVYGYVT